MAAGFDFVLIEIVVMPSGECSIPIIFANFHSSVRMSPRNMTLTLVTIVSPESVYFIDSVPGLTRREREMILSDNPARLLKIS